MKYPLVIAALLAAPLPAFADDGTITGTVDAKPSKFLKDTVVYVKHVDGAKLSPKTVPIDQKGMEFTPHIALLAVGDKVTFDNHDHVDHNVTSPEGSYDLGTWGFNQTKTHAYDKEGVFSQICKIHPEMLAYVFVGQNRLAAVVDAAGKFTIAGVPPGTYELDIWNAKLKAAPQKITVASGGKVEAKFALAR